MIPHSAQYCGSLVEGHAKRWRFPEAMINTQCNEKRNESTLSGSHLFHSSGVFKIFGLKKYF